MNDKRVFGSHAVGAQAAFYRVEYQKARRFCEIASSHPWQGGCALEVWACSGNFHESTESSGLSRG